MLSTIALAGAGGSHPQTIRLISEALQQIAPYSRSLILDLSDFDRRAPASYANCRGDVLRVRPSEIGLRTLFRTTGPNLFLSGGARRFEHMVQMFVARLRRERVRALLTCHSYGFAEQALLRACNLCEIPFAQIDEGPFSGMVASGSTPRPVDRLQRLLARLGLMPTRDQTGSGHALFFPTSPARARKLEERGISPDRIVTVASPRFDALPDVMKAWPYRAPHSSGRLRILALHQPFGRDGKIAKSAAAHAERLLVEGIGKAAMRRPLSLTLRVHPRTDAAELARLQALIAPLGEHAHIGAHAPLYAEFATHDAGVGFYSSALLEAAACGMPTACIPLPREAFSRPVEASKAAALPRLGVQSVDSAHALTRLIENIPATPVTPPARLFEEALGILDGTSSRRVASAMCALAEGKDNQRSTNAQRH